VSRLHTVYERSLRGTIKYGRQTCGLSLGEGDRKKQGNRLSKFVQNLLTTPVFIDCESPIHAKSFWKGSGFRSTEQYSTLEYFMNIWQKKINAPVVMCTVVFTNALFLVPQCRLSISELEFLDF
jgi:hypothetical protein